MCNKQELKGIFQNNKKAFLAIMLVTVGVVLIPDNQGDGHLILPSICSGILMGGGIFLSYWSYLETKGSK